MVQGCADRLSAWQAKAPVRLQVLTREDTRRRFPHERRRSRVRDLIAAAPCTRSKTPKEPLIPANAGRGASVQGDEGMLRCQCQAAFHISNSLVFSVS